MPETPIFKIPTPVAGDPSDAPNQLLAIGDAIEAALIGEVRIVLDGTQEITTGENTAVEFNVVEYDSHGYAQTDGSVLIGESMGGLYSMKTIICFNTDTEPNQNRHGASLEINGNRVASTYNVGNTSWTRVLASADYILSPGDVITALGYQLSGDPVISGSTGNITYLSLSRLRATATTPRRELPPGPYEN